MEKHLGRVDEYGGFFRGESDGSEIIEHGFLSVGQFGGRVGVGVGVAAEKHAPALDEYAVAGKHFLPLLHYVVEPCGGWSGAVGGVFELYEA